MNNEIESNLQRAMQGDRKAAEAVLVQTLPRIRNLIRYLIRGDSDVDDIAQESMIAILKGLHGYRGEGSFDSWVDRIVARTTFAAIRKRKDQPTDELTDTEADTTTQRPDEYAERRQLVAYLDSLSYELRSALVLHHVMEMSVPEIASMLSIPVETVRSRMRLGRQKLRHLFGISNPSSSSEENGDFHDE